MINLQVTPSQHWILCKGLELLITKDGLDLLKREFPDFHYERFAEDAKGLLQILAEPLKKHEGEK